MTDRVTFVFEDCGSVQSAESFVSSVFRLREKINNEKLVYRGHGSATYLLVPTIGRPHRYAGHKKIFSDVDERDLLHRFRRRAYPHFGRSLSAGEALFIGRHYGLPSRLLDWTANALYGLYFACVTCESDAGIVWAMRQRPTALNPYDIASHQSEDDLFDAFLGDKHNTELATQTDDWVKVVYPIFNTPRIVAQDGTFTFHSNPWRALENYKSVKFWSQRTDIAGLHYWRIEAKYKPAIVAELSGLGITHRLVFPDLDGIARSLWETDVLWHGDNGARSKTVLG